MRATWSTKLPGGVRLSHRVGHLSSNARRRQSASARHQSSNGGGTRKALLIVVAPLWFMLTVVALFFTALFDLALWVASVVTRRARSRSVTRATWSWLVGLWASSSTSSR